jgi:surface carbohydrate biosynthesis protein (TIGR04326 family)
MGNMADIRNKHVAVLVFKDHAEVPSGLPADIDVVMWDSAPSVSHRTGVLSIPLIVEKGQERFRDQYLQWLTDFANAPTRGTTVEKFLCIRPGLSYWWLSLPSEFTFSQHSPSLLLVKMMALAEICDVQGVDSLVVIGGERPTVEAISRWCKNSGRRVSFVSTDTQARQLVLDPNFVEKGKISNGRSEVSGNGTLQALVQWGKAFVSAILLATGVFFKVVYKPRRIGSFARAWNGITVIDYVGTPETDTLIKKNFSSRYWGMLVPVLLAEPGSTWLHRRVAGALWKTSTGGRYQRWGVEFDGALHVDVTDEPSVSSLLRGIFLGIRVSARGLYLAREHSLFILKDSGVDAWPIVRASWIRRFAGAEGLKNLLWLCGIERELKDIPKQRLGIFLYENQPWEIALTSAWNRAGHGELIGVAHTTVRFWDLRYALTGLALKSDSKCCPIPDRIASNGPLATKALLEFGLTKDMIVEVEALRYLHLRCDDASPADVQHRKEQVLRVLVLGEYESEAADRQLRFVQEAIEGLPGSYQVIFRPHPASIAPHLSSTKSIEALSALTFEESLLNCDVVLVGETSSVAIEAHAKVKHVAVIADHCLLPTNPLRGSEFVEILNMDTDLRSWLTAIGAGRIGNKPAFDPSSLLLLDPSLTRWKRLLSKKSETGEKNLHSDCC